MTKEELMITSMLSITSWELNCVKKELEDLGDLVVERDLLRTWTRDKEGLELFGEKLAQIEVEVAQNVERKKMLERQRDWYEKRHDWLEQKLQMYRGNDEKDYCDSAEIKEEVPF